MILSQYSVRSVKLLAAYLFLLWRPDKFCKINLTVERKRNIINGWYLYFPLHTVLHCCSPSIAVANTKAKHVMNPCEEFLPCSKMPCTASVSILEAKEIQNLSWLLETMKIRWDYLVINCATLNCCNKTDWQCIKGTVLKWVLERCLGPSQDYMTCPFFWNPPGFKLPNTNMLIASPALHLMYTVKTIKWKSTRKNFRKYLNLQSQLHYFPFILSLLPFKPNNKKSLNTLT